MLRDRKYKLPEPDARVLRDVLPFLCSLHVSFLISGPVALDALPTGEED